MQNEFTSVLVFSFPTPPVLSNHPLPLPWLRKLFTPIKMEWARAKSLSPRAVVMPPPWLRPMTMSFQPYIYIYVGSVFLLKGNDSPILSLYSFCYFLGPLVLFFANLSPFSFCYCTFSSILFSHFLTHPLISSILFLSPQCFDLSFFFKFFF